MLRDFFDANAPTLHRELLKIEDLVDEQTWKALNGVRDLGNIGAHPEKDINVIVDIQPEGAARLIRLIEILIKTWYVTREEDQATLDEIARLAAEKKQEQKSKSPTAEEPSEE